MGVEGLLCLQYLYELTTGLSYARLIHSTPLHPVNLRSILIDVRPYISNYGSVFHVVSSFQIFDYNFISFSRFYWIISISLYCDMFSLCVSHKKGRIN